MSKREFDRSLLAMRRSRAGLTLEQLSRRTATCYRNQVHNYEIGKVKPRHHKVAELALALGCEVSDLMTDDKIALHERCALYELWRSQDSKTRGPWHEMHDQTFGGE